ncbi:Hypothetical protein A7982_05796 [Minicystis rosea]|nr:Hypothetical protein A7982_05796 [Minicystis rosea]
MIGAVLSACALVPILTRAWEPSRRIVAPSPSPLLTAALKPSERFELEATVVERIPAGSYAYFHVRDDAGADRWIVTLASLSPRTATRVRAKVFGRATDFESKRLQRRFDTLLFAIVQLEKESRP